MDNDVPDEESVKEFALDEGISEDEALNEIQEIAEDAPEELIDVEDEDDGE